MNENRCEQIAKEIMNQIGFGEGVDGRPGVVCMMAWGASKFRWHHESEEERHIGALSFRVNGFKFKGIVQIELAYDDTYRIRFFKRYRDGDVLEAINNVFFDELTKVIDSTIEHSGDLSGYSTQCARFMFESVAQV